MSLGRGSEQGICLWLGSLVRRSLIPSCVMFLISRFRSRENSACRCHGAQVTERDGGGI